MTREVLVHDRWPLHHLSFDVAGTKSTSEPVVCERLLSSLIAHGLGPEVFDTDEDPKRPFALADVLKMTQDSFKAAQGQPQADIFLRRRTEPAYEAFWCRATMAMVTFSFGATTHSRFGVSIAAFADDAVTVLQPDFASLVPYARLRPGTTPLVGDDSAKSLLDRGAVLPSSFAAQGVGGLGYRTYVGPFVAQQLGLERIATLPQPISVLEMPWGGWRIDLAPDPWNAEWPVIRASYEAAMERLAPANWFARPVLDARGFWRFTPPPGARWSPNPIKFF
jgi:hypothetical protein